MKVITLNIWGGRAGKEKLLSFFDQYKNTADVFCLQEVWSDAYDHLDGHVAGGKVIRNNDVLTHGVQAISEILSEHTGYFRPHFGDNYGLMMFVRKGLKVLAEGEVFVHREKGYVPGGDVGNHARNIQYVTLVNENKVITIINFHGLWNGMGKTDTEDRLNQSRNIIKFINSLDGEHVLCGDFNLLPETESIKMFEQIGLKNLIKEHKINSTRSSFYQKPEKFADYILLSAGLKERDFKVLKDEVSDHLPLYLEI